MKMEDVHACVTVNNEDHLMSLIDHDPVLHYACMLLLHQSCNCSLNSI